MSTSSDAACIRLSAVLTLAELWPPLILDSKSWLMKTSYPPRIMVLPQHEAHGLYPCARFPADHEAKIDSHPAISLSAARQLPGLLLQTGAARGAAALKTVWHLPGWRPAVELTR